MTALYGTFVRLQTMADGGVRLVLDLGCSLADIAALNLIPGAAFGLARITGESTIAPIEDQPVPKTKSGPLCRLACTLCASEDFQAYHNEIRLRHSGIEYGGSNEGDCKQYILGICGVYSRKELDGNPSIENRFHQKIRIPFLEWMAD
jgi:hypothetical protein